MKIQALPGPKGPESGHPGPDVGGSGPGPGSKIQNSELPTSETLGLVGPTSPACPLGRLGRSGAFVIGPGPGKSWVSRDPYLNPWSLALAGPQPQQPDEEDNEKLDALWMAIKF